MFTSSNSSTLDTGRRVSVIVHQHAPTDGSPSALTPVKEELDFHISECDRLGALASAASIAPSKEARNSAYQLLYELTGTIREIGLNVTGSPVENKKLLERPHSNAPAGVLIAASGRLMEKVVGPNPDFFASAGVPIERLEETLDAFKTAHQSYEDAEFGRRNADKELKVMLRRVRKSVKAVGAVLRAVYGSRHKVLVLYREAKRIRQLNGGKGKPSAETSTPGVTKVA